MRNAFVRVAWLKKIMSELLGFCGIALVALLTSFGCRLWPSAQKVLFVALTIRVLVLILGHFFVSLPDSGTDAVKFERVAWEWSQGGLFEALGNFPGPHSYFISWILAVLYSVTERSLLMGQSVSLLFGMGTVLVGWLVARKLWGEQVGAKAGWILAFFPTLILYSALTMREAYITFFVAVALYGVTAWFQQHGTRPLIIAFSGFVGATFFHGAMLVGALAFFGLIVTVSMIRLARAMRRRSTNLIALTLAIVAAAAIGTYVAGGFSVPKLGTFENATDIDRLVQRMERSTRSDAAYPEWTVPKSITELMWKGPARATYFVYSPFPWDVQTSVHLIGLIDGVLYFVLTLLIWCNRKLIWQNWALRSILLIVFFYFFVFGLAIGNFGTGIRHRSKFLIALVILAAPMLPSFRLRPGSLTSRSRGWLGPSQKCAPLV